MLNAQYQYFQVPVFSLHHIQTQKYVHQQELRCFETDALPRTATFFA